ncbi:MAG: TAT-variant-translocated molybdopterin oxidoreductase [Chitinophagaceae bacterium]
MAQSKIWQSFGQLNQSEEFTKSAKDEFREELPFESDGGLLDAKTPRRDFLKFLGYSTAAATLAASCEQPVKHAIPYVNKPESIMPGVANYYATTYVQDGDVVSVVAKVRDGRPIKIEGNTLSPITKGATSARAQASVLDLYDTARLRYPKQRIGEDWKEVSTFETIDKMIGEAMLGIGSGSVAILSSTIVSPSTKQLIGEFLSKYPGGRHVQYDAVSYSGMIQANEASYGKKGIPSYQFDNAKVIVSLACDFLGTWLSPVEFAKQYAKGRKIDEKAPVMSKHYQFESIMSMTGANADERFTHRPSEAGTVALALLNAINGTAPTVADAKLKTGITKAAADLKAAGGNALVVSGSNDTNVQVIVNAINEAIGANGKTINWAIPVNYRQGVDADMAKLVADMNAGTVGALLIAGANPMYSHPMADKFKSGIARVKLAVSFNEKMDETTALCNYVIPTHHYLESWGDAEPKQGYYSLIQPTINPLFKTRAWQDSLLKWSGKSTATPVATMPATGKPDSTQPATVMVPAGATNDYLAYLKTFWLGKLGGSVATWDAALRDGVINPSGEMTMGGAAFSAGAIAPATAAIAAAKKGGDYEVFLYEKVGIGAGQQGNNPWLLELPDPVTKATWDNYAMISAGNALKLFGIDMTDNGDIDAYEAHPLKWVMKIKTNGKEIALPIIIVPGVDANTVGIALGFGRSKDIGVATKEAGKNAFPLATFNGTTIDYLSISASVEKTDEKYSVAQNQIHSSYTDSLGVDRIEVVRETTMATYMQHPEYIKHWREALAEDYTKTGEMDDYRDQGSLYDPKLNERPGIHWGMSVDMNSCNGCGACVVACTAENNVSIVGKREVLRGHDMQWLRIDRYFVTDSTLDPTTKKPNPDAVKGVVFQPMMCQHCDNAPCENVCPVAATNHSSEGLNQMTYNRCIGTRYCANNCPFKVRRFNWADYTGADSFPDNQRDHISDATMMMNDDLTRMVLNPDVTVRSRGVIEKCSFCVQRLQEGKLNAKKHDRPVIDGEIKVACQQSCPTEAIVFGDINDSKSAIRKIRADNPNRMFVVLEQLHVLPNVTYLAKVRNTDEILKVNDPVIAENKKEVHNEEHKEVNTEVPSEPH